MSNAQTRLDIAAALDTVDGVHGYAARPNVLGDGDAWPQWRGSEYAGGHAQSNTWAVMIVLPQADDVAADAFVDTHGDVLADALREHLTMDGFTPVKLDTETGDVYALMITGRSE